MVQLEAELPDVRDAQRQRRDFADVQLTGAEEGERLAGEIGFRQALEELARPRAPRA